MKKLHSAFALVSCLFGAHVMAQHEGDIDVARTQGNKLVIGDWNPATDFILLNPVSNPILQIFGFAAGDPGFDYLRSFEEVPPNLLALQSGAEIWVEVVALHPAFRVIGPGGTPILDQPGERVLLGGATLHEHLTWHANSQDPDFNPAETEWTATFKLVDEGTTAYSDSDPIILRFVSELPAVPTASQWGLAVLALTVLVGGTVVLRAVGRIERA